ncbi:hypothetical protein QL285_026375 [Trifolium repens]|nr:hypothetical protein QL285_026375 [Trifolium repens]
MELEKLEISYHSWNYASGSKTRMQWLPDGLAAASCSSPGERDRTKNEILHFSQFFHSSKVPIPSNLLQTHGFDRITHMHKEFQVRVQD